MTAETEFAEKRFTKLKGGDVEVLKSEINSVLKDATLTVFDNFADEYPVLGETEVDFESMDMPEIIDWCIENERDNAITGRLFEVFRTQPEIVGLVNDEFFHNATARLGLDHPMPSTTPTVRIDRPSNEYAAPTHQDYWTSYLSPNAVIFWLPLRSLSDDMGPLKVIPGSHKQGPVPIREYEGHFPYTTKREYNDADFKTVPMEDDEILAMNQLTIHRSGENHSNKARVTIQIRFNDLTTAEAPTASFTPKYSPHVLENQEKHLADSQDD